MTRRFALWWWPLFFLASPVLIPFLAIKRVIFKNRQVKARQINQKRMAQADKLDLPLLETLELSPVVEWKSKDGFHSAPGVLYFFRTDKGTLLFDVGFGPEDGVFAHNARLMGISWDQVDALVISHLHMDHMGGSKAQFKKTVRVPAQLGQPSTIPCFLPDQSSAPGFQPTQVTRPTLVGAGLGSTGPLARSLFLMGWLMTRGENRVACMMFSQPPGRLCWRIGPPVWGSGRGSHIREPEWSVCLHLAFSK